MKKILIILFSAVFIFGQLNCANTPTANNSNLINANSQANAAAPTTFENNETADANVKVKETPLPEFTNANEALAEGDKLFDASENEKAIEAFKQAVKLDPDLAEAYFKLGITYSLWEKENTGADAPVEEPTPAKTVKKGKKEVLVKTESDKAFANAVKAYEKILAKNPKDDVAQFNIGRSYNKLNEDEDAVKALRQAVKLKPEDSEYLTELGAILIKLAQYQEAVTFLKKAVKLDENNSQAEQLLEKAEAGRKRIDFGVDKLKQAALRQAAKN
jgi:tetratricopeptide (TPR) repeat protein